MLTLGVKRAAFTSAGEAPFVNAPILLALNGSIKAKMEWEKVCVKLYI